MNIDTNALLSTKSDIENQKKKFVSAANEITRLLNQELIKVWVDEASTKLNEKYNSEGKMRIDEVNKILTEFIDGIQTAVDEFEDTVNRMSNSI